MQKKAQINWRLISWSVVIVVALASVVMMMFNYRTLEEAVTTIENTIAEQVKLTQKITVKYRETQAQLDVVTEDLKVANEALALTRTELSSVQGLNDQLKVTIKDLEKFKSDALVKEQSLNAMIEDFKKKNLQLDMDLQSVRKELALYQTDISSSDEGRSKVQLFKDHIRKVKKNMVVIKKQAWEAQEAARKERDRLAVLYGNRGFMVRSGENVSLKGFRDQVDIDVKLVNP